MPDPDGEDSPPVPGPADGETRRLRPEAYKSWRQQVACNGFEPNIFRPNICKKCAKKKELHSEEGPTRGSPLGAERKLSITSVDELDSSVPKAADGGGGVHGADVEEVAAAKSSNDWDERRVDVAKGGDDKESPPADEAKAPPPMLRTHSLKQALNTPSKIAPELKAELCDIVLGRKKCRGKGGEAGGGVEGEEGSSPSHRPLSPSRGRRSPMASPRPRRGLPSSPAAGDRDSRPGSQLKVEVDTRTSTPPASPPHKAVTPEHREEALQILLRSSGKNISAEEPQPSVMASADGNSSRPSSTRKNSGPTTVMDFLPAGPLPTRLLIKRIRTVGVSSLLLPSKYILYYQNHTSRSIMVAEGQRGVDPKKLVDTTYSIFSGQMDQGVSLLGTIRRSPTLAPSHPGEVIYELSCPQPGSFNPPVLALFHFITGFADNQSNPRQAHVFLAQQPQEGIEVPPTIQQLYYGAHVPGTTHLQSKEASWNHASGQHECPLLPGGQLEEGLEPSIKTAQLVGSGRMVSLQMYRPGADKEVFLLDTSGPFSMIQAFAFAIANIECAVKGAKVLPVTSEPSTVKPAPASRLSQPQVPPAPSSNKLFQTVISMMRFDRAYDYQDAGAEPSPEFPDYLPERNSRFYYVQKDATGGGADRAVPTLPPYIPQGIPSQGSQVTLLQACMGYRRMWEDYKKAPLPPATLRALRRLVRPCPMSLGDVWVISLQAFRLCDPLIRLSLLSVVVAMLAELYPLSPTYNSLLGFANMFIMANIHSFTSPFLLTYTMLITLSVLIDVNWLLEMPLMGFMVGLKCFSAAMVVLNILIKCTLCVKGLHMTTAGGQVTSFLWSYLKMCFPPMLGATKKALITEIYGRVIILTWMQFAGALMYFIMFFVVLGDFEMAELFDLGLGGAPLSGLVIIKGMTLLFVSGAMYRNVQTTPCLGMFGCLTCCYHWAMVKELKQRRKYGGVTPPVLIKGSWAKTIVLFKGLDLAVSAVMWAVLVLNYDTLMLQSPYAIQQMCCTIYGMSFVVDVWALVLGISVVWLVSIHRYRRTLDQDLADEGADTAADELINGPGHLVSKGWSSSSFHEGGDGEERSPSSIFTSQESSLSENRYSSNDNQQGAPNTAYEGCPTFLFLDYFRFTPEDFQSLWERLPSAVGFQCYVQFCPTIQDMTNHLHGVSFFVIASGITGSVMRTFACARGQMIENRQVMKEVTFLMQIDLDASNSLMSANFKCEDSEHLGDFIHMLALGDIVGEYSVVV